ncbi:MAG: hypothetical protein NXI22_08790 [bacterium]|nr:hypothetical protein [bacterium]
MKWTPAFVRKIIYLSIIVLLLFPLYWLGAPPTAQTEDIDSDASVMQTLGGIGVLSRMRRREDLAQVDLGDIDPASETMKLSCFGLHGLAVNMLWSQAHEYKKRKDFDHMYLVLKQIAKLQPNFLSVWEFQSHNVSYNVSVDYDDYRQRYHWVRKGILFMLGGVRHNRRDTKMVTTVGLYTGLKIGTADEKDQYRRLYKEDFEFHDAMVPYIPIYSEDIDNWMAAYLWYKQAEEMVRNDGVPIRGPDPVMFYRMTPMQFFNYGAALYREADPEEAETARIAWGDGNRMWVDEYGKRSLRTSYGVPIVLEDKEEIDANIEKLTEELSNLAPGVKEKLAAEHLKSLSTVEREAYEKAPEQRSAAETEAMPRIEAKLKVSPEEIAEALPDDVKVAARALATKISYEVRRAQQIEHYRGVVNYVYWRQRSASEAEEETKSARGHVFRAKQFLAEAKLNEAIAEFEQAWKDWDVVFRRHVNLVEDITKQDLVDDIRAYRQALEAAELEFPKDFVLNYMLEARDDATDLVNAMNRANEREEATDGDDPPSTEDGASAGEEPPLP